jgi:hypothetical protein
MQGRQERWWFLLCIQIMATILREGQLDRLAARCGVKRSRVSCEKLFGDYRFPRNSADIRDQGGDRSSSSFPTQGVRPRLSHHGMLRIYELR